MEYDEALRGGFLSGFFSSFGVAPSGSGFPRLRITRGFPFTRRVGVRGVPCSRTANSAASAVALSTIAGTPWGSALSTRFTGSGSGILVQGSGSGFQFGGAVVVFFPGRGRGFVF